MKKLLLFICLGYCTLTFSQNAILSSGNNADSSFGTTTYSVGLIHYKEAVGTGGSSSTGTQIAYEILTLSTQDVENKISIQVFPNPTSDYIYINLAKKEDLTYKLIDISGRELSTGTISEMQSKINLSEFNSAVYILNIYKNNSSYKSYKIIKR